jgi:hypothetical protein
LKAALRILWEGNVRGSQIVTATWLALLCALAPAPAPLPAPEQSKPSVEPKQPAAATPPAADDLPAAVASLPAVAALQRNDPAAFERFRRRYAHSAADARDDVVVTLARNALRKSVKHLLAIASDDILVDITETSLAYMKLAEQRAVAAMASSWSPWAICRPGSGWRASVQSRPVCEGRFIRADLGDVLMVTRIDRFAYSIGDLQDIVQNIKARGALIEGNRAVDRR